MSRRDRKTAQPGRGPCANAGPSVTESCSVEERAGAPPLPLVELRPTAPTPFLSESGPREPVRLVNDRAAALARIGVGFESFTDDELLVAQHWLLGHTLGETCLSLDKDVRAVRKLWANVRRKLHAALLAGVVQSATAPAVPA